MRPTLTPVPTQDHDASGGTTGKWELWEIGKLRGHRVRLTHHCAREGNTATLSQTNVIHFEVLVHTKGHGERAGREAWVEPKGTHKKHPRVYQFHLTHPGPGQWAADHSPGWVPHMEHSDKHVPMCGEALQPKGTGAGPRGAAAQRGEPTIQ